MVSVTNLNYLLICFIFVWKLFWSHF